MATRSRKFMFAVLGIGLLIVLSAIGVLIGNAVMKGLALTLLIGSASLLILDATLAVRRIERRMRVMTKQIKRAGERAPEVYVEPAPNLGDSDLIGTIRLLQAQYVGRLDRAQATLEEALERLPSDSRKD